MRKISRQKIHDVRGTTLIEMILYLAIVSVLLTGVGAVTASVIDAKMKTQAVGAVFNTGTSILSVLDNEVGRASTISVPAAGATSTNLVFERLAPGNPEAEVRVEDGALLLVTGGATIERLSSPDVRVDNMRFESIISSPLSATTSGVRIFLTVSASTTGIWQEFRFTESFNTSSILDTYR